MQDEINEKIVSLSIRLSKETAKLTEQTLKDAMRCFLEDREKPKAASREKKTKAISVSRGKQTVAKLMEQNQGLSNMEITDGNIKSFERIARKYNIDFALKKLLNRALEITKNDREREKQKSNDRGQAL